MCEMVMWMCTWMSSLNYLKREADYDWCGLTGENLNGCLCDTVESDADAFMNECHSGASIKCEVDF